MVGPRRLLWAGFGLLMITSAMAAEPPPPPTFTNLAGEQCRLLLRGDITGDPAAPPPMQLICGNAIHASGAISLLQLPLTLPSDPDGRKAALIRVAAASPARREAASRMACRAGKWLTLANRQEAYAEPCSLIDGEWAYVQMQLPINGYLALVEGLPTNLASLIDASSRLAGLAATDSGMTESSAVNALLEQIFSGPAPLVSSADLDRFAELTQTARLANSHRDFRAAEDADRAALLILERAQTSDSPGVGKLLIELALQVSNQGRSEEAAALFRRSDPIIQRSPNPADLARYNGYLAFDAANGGRYADALTYARAASAGWRDLADSGSTNLDNLGEDVSAVWRGELAHSLNTQAAMALRTGELSEAESSAKEALQIIGDSRNLPPWWRPEILNTLGRVHAALGRLNEAEASFRGALVYQQRLFGDSAPTASTLLSLSGVYADEGLFDDSLRAYDVAMKILAADDVARSQIPFDQVAPMLIAASAIAERSPARRAEMSGKIVQALQLLSAGVVDQTIAQASLRLAAQNPQMQELVRGLQEAERYRDTARIALAHETSQPDEDRGAAKETALLGVIEQQTARRDALLQRLNSEFPAYAQLTRPRAVTLPDLQGQLHPAEAMVIFAIGRSRAFAVVITADRLSTAPLAIDEARLDDQIRTLRKAFISTSGRLNEFDLTLAHELYKSLFGPLEKDLVGISQLVLVQGGALSSLPAALLVTSAPGNDRDYRHAAWLTRKYASIEVPSIRAFAELRRRAAQPRTAGRAFFGIGNPAFIGDEADAASGKNPLSGLAAVCRDDGPFPAAMLRRLTPLPDTATELRTVAKALGADDSSLLLGTAATEAGLRAQSLSDVRVLYFATHALLPGELSCQSEPALALSPPTDAAQSRDQDGLLDASEVAGLSLNADLVVLSACNTGQSESKFGGQALSGLAEAFFYAGARSLVASHWQVPSAATAKLMVGVFDRLVRNPAGGTAQAMRASQLAMLDQAETSHPFFWASFTIIGDSSPASLATALSSRQGG